LTNLQEPLVVNLTHLESVLSELHQVKVFDRVHLDTKEVDAENDTVLKGARLRLFLGKKILTVALKVTLSYPEDPIKFTYGSM